MPKPFGGGSGLRPRPNLAETTPVTVGVVGQKAGKFRGLEVSQQLSSRAFQDAEMNCLVAQSLDCGEPEPGRSTCEDMEVIRPRWRWSLLLLGASASIS